MQAVDLMNMVSTDFAKLGNDSLEGLSNLSLHPQSSDYLNLDGEIDCELNLNVETSIKGKPIKLSKIDDETTVFGIDTSNIILGNTGNGILCAVRGSVVWRERGTYQYARHGPFIFNITERNRYTLYNTLRQLYLEADDSVGAPILERTVERIRSILERWLQRQLCEATHNSIILWDGSLTTRTVNGPISVVGDILRTARDNGNCILALSKNTSLSTLGRGVNDLIDCDLAPCLLDIDDTVRQQYGNRLHFFGKIYAAKLAPAPFTFRLDIDRRISGEQGLNAVSKLLGNELLTDGYPETLRLAHIFSRFSASEVLAMQKYLATNYGLRINPIPDIRQALFGPYGGSVHARSDGYDAGL